MLGKEFAASCSPAGGVSPVGRNVTSSTNIVDVVADSNSHIVDLIRQIEIVHSTLGLVNDYKDKVAPVAAGLKGQVEITREGIIMAKRLMSDIIAQIGVKQ